jgi:DNA replication protein DnaC
MLTELLTELKMKGALGSLEKLQANITDRDEFAKQILLSELEFKNDRALKRRLSQAKFPFVKEWSEIDQSLNPQIEFNKIESFFNGNFVEKQQNLCFMGVPGTGKTHSLLALGRELCRKGIPVLFFTACELVNALEEAKKEYRLSKLMATLKKPKLLIVDELGFVPLSETGARLLFDVFASRYERGSIAVSTNLSFDKWVQIFVTVELTTALIDRFTHRADIFTFQGQSVRLLEARGKFKKKYKKRN